MCEATSTRWSAASRFASKREAVSTASPPASGPAGFSFPARGCVFDPGQAGSSRCPVGREGASPAVLGAADAAASRHGSGGAGLGHLTRDNRPPDQAIKPEAGPGHLFQSAGKARDDADGRLRAAASSNANGGPSRPADLANMVRSIRIARAEFLFCPLLCT